MQLTSEQRRLLLDSARRTISAMLRGKPPPNDDDRVESVVHPAGCFVSLHELHTRRLRGCVGRLDARDPLHLAVQEAARNVLFDPRFAHEPIAFDDLLRIEIELTIVSRLSVAAHVLDFDPLMHGIYLIIGSRSGCFLPQVARETGWTRHDLLRRLCIEKLGIEPDGWEDPTARLHTFTTDTIGPEPFGEFDLP